MMFWYAVLFHAIWVVLFLSRSSELISNKWSVATVLYTLAAELTLSVPNNHKNARDWLKMAALQAVLPIYFILYAKTRGQYVNL